MNPREVAMITIYKMAAADGKIGGGANKIKEMLNLSDEEFEEKVKNLENEFAKLSKDAKEAVLGVAEFIMKVDGAIDPKEEELFKKLSSL